MMEPGYILLAFVLVQPALAWVLMAKVRQMHLDTLKFMKETQVVGGSPVHLMEKRQELVAEQTKDERDRKAYIQDEMKRRALQALG